MTYKEALQRCVDLLSMPFTSTDYYDAWEMFDYDISCMSDEDKLALRTLAMDEKERPHPAGFLIGILEYHL